MYSANFYWRDPTDKQGYVQDCLHTDGIDFEAIVKNEDKEEFLPYMPRFHLVLKCHFANVINQNCQQNDLKPYIIKYLPSSQFTNGFKTRFLSNLEQVKNG